MRLAFPSTTKNLAIAARLLVLVLMIPATPAFAQTVTYLSTESRTIRDFEDDGIPDFVQPFASHLEVDERLDDARRVAIEFDVPVPLGPIVDAKVRLHQQSWPNDSIDWYVAPDTDGNIAINDWYNTGFIGGGSFTASVSGIDELDVTTELQSMLAAGDDYFRVGLRMTDPLDAHALFNSHTSSAPPELVVTYTPDCVEPPPNMVSWWSGDICLPDDIIGPNDGTYMGFPTCSIHWKVGGGALNFDASNPDWVVVPHHSSLDVGASGFSVDAWIRTGNASGTIMTKGESPGFQLYVTGGKLGFLTCGPMSCSAPQTSTTSIDDLAWHHIAVTRSELGGISTLTLYVDGVAESTLSLTIGSPNNTDPLLMGAPGGPLAPDYLHGQLDEVEYFRRALTPAEVLDLYQADTAGKCKELCTQPPWYGMVAWYPLDETTGSIANEAVNNLDGIYVNGPTPALGKVADALSFDGANDRLQVADDPVLDMASGVFSVDFWIHPDDTETHGAVIKKGEDSGSWTILTGNGYQFFYSGGHFIAFFRGSGGTGYVGDLSPLFTHHADPGEWTFVAITVNLPANIIELYINGVLAQTTITPPGIGVDLSNDEPLQLGGQTTPGNGRSFDGRLDEVEFFDRILTATEIEDIWLAGAAGKCKDDIGLPWDHPFCNNAEHVTVPVNVCNHSVSDRDYLLSFGALPAGSSGPGGNCHINGPDQFYDAGTLTPIPPALALTIPASTCQTAPIRIDRPAMMDMDGEVGCYTVTLLETGSGIERRRTASVQDTRDACAVPILDDGGFQPLDPGDLTTVSFELINTSEEPINWSYELEAYGPEMAGPSTTLSLNAQEPGVSVRDTVQLEPLESAELSFQVEAVGEQLPFGFQDLVLSRVQAELRLPLASVGIHRRPAPSLRLGHGSSISDLSGSIGDQHLMELEVPGCAASLTVQTSGGEGNPDLYLRYGSAPTPTSFDCRSAGSGPEEGCQIHSPQAGTWYAMVYGQSDYVGLGLDVDLQLTGEADLGVSLDNGLAEVNPGQEITYAVTVSQSGPCSVSEINVAPTLSKLFLDAEISADQGTYDLDTGFWSNLQIEAGGQAVLEIRGTVAAEAGPGVLESSVSVSLPGDITDPSVDNNMATDSDSISVLSADLFADGFESGDIQAWN